MRGNTRATLMLLSAFLVFGECNLAAKEPFTIPNADPSPCAGCFAQATVSRVNFEKANFFQGRRPFPIPGKNTRSPVIVP